MTDRRALLSGEHRETRSLLRLTDLDAAQLSALLDRACALAERWDARDFPRSLAGVRLGLVVEEPGWRNPVAMALGIRTMGGDVEALPAGISQRETPGDLGRYLANWFDALAVRAPDIAWVEALAQAFPGPVLNLRTRANHPFEVLGDLAFLQSAGRDISRLRVCVVAPAGNILASWAEAAAVVGVAVTQVFDPALRAGEGDLGFSEDMGVLREADVIVTDCWPRGEGARDYAAWRVTGALLDSCRPDVAFIPCPPVTRGEEVDEAAMAHPRQMSWRAKAFLMHVQLAFLEGALHAQLR